MKNLEYQIQINASPEKVWKVLFTQDAEKKWASAVNEGTFFEGNWEEDSVMRFLDSQNNGMYNLVEKNILNKELKMKHLGWILNGEISPQNWEDSTIEYILETNEDGTLLTGKINALNEFVDFFNSKYPQNFQNIKNLAEKY